MYCIHVYEHDIKFEFAFSIHLEMSGCFDMFHNCPVKAVSQTMFSHTSWAHNFVNSPGQNEVVRLDIGENIL